MKTIKSSRSLLPHAIFAAALALSTGSLVRAQYNPPPVSGTTTLVGADTKFLNKAAHANSEEVAIARIAAGRSTNADVRTFAQKLVAAHESMETDLSRLTAAKAVSLETTDLADVNRKWSEKKGTDFDKDFVKEMISAHKKAVSLFEKGAKETKDGEVAAFARDHLAALNAHLRDAEDLAKLLK